MLSHDVSRFFASIPISIAGHKAYLGLNSDDCYPVQGHRAFFWVIFERLQQLGVLISLVGSGHPITGEYHQVRMPELSFWRSMRRASAKKKHAFFDVDIGGKKAL